MIRRKRSMRSRVCAALTSKSAGAPRQRIGVMGGTLDPIHNDHLVVASGMVNRFGLGLMLFVPMDEPWRKHDQKVSHSKDRHPMMVITAASNPQFSVSRVDIDQPGTAYAVDTLWNLKVIYPSADLFFIIDADALQRIMTWWDQEEIFDTATFVGIAYPGIHLRAEDPGGVGASWLHLIGTPAAAISSTDYRKCAEAGCPVWYLVPDRVAQHVAKRGLCQPSEGAVGSVGPASVDSTSEGAALVNVALVDTKSDTVD